MTPGRENNVRVGIGSGLRIDANDRRYLAAFLSRTNLPLEIVPAENAEIILLPEGSAERIRSDVVRHIIDRTPIARGTAEATAYLRSWIPLPGLQDHQRNPSTPLRCDVVQLFRMVMEGWQEDESPRDEHTRRDIAQNPIVDSGEIGEPWLDAIAAMVGQSWSALLQRPPVTPEWFFCLSFDIDSAGMFFGTTPIHTLKQVKADKLARFFGAAISTVFDKSNDPHLTFEFLLPFLQTQDIRASFFVQTHRNHKRDSYDLTRARQIQNVMQWAIVDGHAVGLHSSYVTRDGGQEFYHEQWKRLRKILGPGVSPIHRAHYLRTPDDLTLYEAEGPIIDSSLMFGRRSGFRRQTSKPFRLGNQLIESPPCVMDTTLRYQEKLSPDVAISEAVALMHRVRATGGIFTPIWHPHNLNTLTWEEWVGVLFTILGEAKRFRPRFQTLADATNELQSRTDSIEAQLARYSS